MNFQMLAALCLIFSWTNVYSLTLVYKQYIKSKELLYTLKMNSLPGGFHLAVHSDVGGDGNFFLGSDSGTLVWRYLNPAKKTDVESIRVGNDIIMKAVQNGKNFDKIIKINSDVWIEQWEIGLESFIISKSMQKTFWSINPSDIDQVAEFSALKEGEQSIKVNGSWFDTEKVKIALAGALGGLFHFEFYFRKSDGRLLLQVYPEGPNGSAARIELVSEKD